MVFKKNDEATRLAAIKGGQRSIKLHPEKANILKLASREISRNHMIEINKNKTKEEQSKAGKLSRYYENKKAEQIKNNYDNVFKPNVICDRICIKDDKIIFVEIKRIGQKLRPKQQEFKELCEKLGYEYVVEYI